MDLEPIDLLNALADSTRLRIVTLLNRHRELCVCELVDALVTHQPKVSKHLAILRKARIIRGRRAGQWIHYRLDPELPVWAQRVIDEITEGCESKSDFIDDERRLASRAQDVCATK